MPFPSPRDLPRPRDGIQVSCIAGRFFTIVNLPYYFSHSNAILIHFLKLQYFSTEDKSNLTPISNQETSRVLPRISGGRRWERLVPNPSANPPDLLPTSPFSPINSPWLLCSPSTSKLLQLPSSLNSHRISWCLNWQYKCWHRPPGLSKGHGKRQK